MIRAGSRLSVLRRSAELEHNMEEEMNWLRDVLVPVVWSDLASCVFPAYIGQSLRTVVARSALINLAYLNRMTFAPAHEYPWTLVIAGPSVSEQLNTRAHLVDPPADVTTQHMDLSQRYL